MDNKHIWLLTLSGAVLLALSWPYTGSQTWLVFFSLVPLLFVEKIVSIASPTSNQRKPKLSVLVYVYFLLFNLLTSWWIGYASFFGMIFTNLAYALLMTFVFMLFSFSKKKLGSFKGYIALVFYWLGFEYLHYYWELSHPWLTLGNVFSIRPSWVQWYEYTGVLGGTLWIWLLNILIFGLLNYFFLKKRVNTFIYKRLIIIILIFFLPLFFSLYVFNTYKDSEDKIKVLIVQPNIDSYEEKFNLKNIDYQTQLLKKMITSLDKVDLIVAPETALIDNLDENNLFYSDQLRIVADAFMNTKAKALLIGASTFKTYPSELDKKPTITARKIKFGWIDFYNTALFLTKEKKIQTYHKSKLVLGVERLPFLRFMPFMEDLSIDLGGSYGSLGTEKISKVFSVDSIRLVPAICYESVYGEYITEFVKKGANLITVITNDGWWKDTPGYRQHFSYSVLRAIETRRSIVRSANTGISGIIDSKGQIKKTLGWGKLGTLSGEVGINKKLTIFVEYGDILGRVCSGFSLLILLYALVFRKRLNL